MSEITIDTFTSVIKTIIRPPLFLVEKKEQPENITVEIRYAQLRSTTKAQLLEPLVRLFEEEATDEAREVLTKELIHLAAHTLHHSNHLLTACLTKETNSNRHYAYLYIEGKEVLHRIMTDEKDILPFVRQIDQLIQKFESD